MKLLQEYTPRRQQSDYFYNIFVCTKQLEPRVQNCLLVDDDNYW